MKAKLNISNWKINCLTLSLFGALPISFLFGVPILGFIFLGSALASCFIPKRNSTQKKELVSNVYGIPQKELRWSLLMGPCTRQRAMEIIGRKKKGGRLPTQSELENDLKSPYYGDWKDLCNWRNYDNRCDQHYRCFWLQDEGSLIRRPGGSVLRDVPKNTKAYFAIVWEV